MSRMDCGLRRNDGRAARAPTRDTPTWGEYTGQTSGMREERMGRMDSRFRGNDELCNGFLAGE